MRLRTSLTFWTTTLCSTLGLPQLTACGGTFTDSARQDQGTADSGTGGDSPGSGGQPGTGGKRGDGGDFTGTGGVAPASGGLPGTGGVAPTGGAVGYLPCANPVPVMGPGNQLTGFVSCAQGAVHRAGVSECPTSLPRADSACKPWGYDGGAPSGFCTHDSDCTAQPNGWCTGGSYPGGPEGCWCQYGCLKDADCGAGQICQCGDPVGQCVAATCKADSDCAPGALCLSYVQDPGCGGTAYACQTVSDTCVGSTDCDPNSSARECALVDGAHQCQSPMCAIGRPFLVAGEARLAETACRRDWSSELVPSTSGLAPAARASIAARWTEIGLMEHASIAAFARFALEILSLGAPPELVVATHAAMADETVHARDAFALASGYAGRAVGPGALDVDASLGARSALDIVRTTILEGCLGETVAAVEAAEALAHATDPAVREALAKVTLDETRHAELAWRFVQWVLEHGAPELREAVATELVGLTRTELGRAATVTSPARPRFATEMRSHGVLDEASRAEIRRRVLAEVVVPCAEALVSRRAAPRSAPIAA